MTASNVNCAGLCLGGVISNELSTLSVDSSTFTNVHSLAGGAIAATNSFLSTIITGTTVLT